VKVPQVKYAFPNDFEVNSSGERGGDTMKMKKDIVLAILASFCLAVTLFSLAPVRSAQPYDPWSDIDDNGKIDMKDIGNVAARFMTAGDSTKNVTVTNWPVDRPSLNQTLGSGILPANGMWWSEQADIDGYRTYYLYVQSVSVPIGACYVYFTAGGIEGREDKGNLGGPSIFILGPYDVKGLKIRVLLFSGSSVDDGPVSVGLYALP
jgi:hypothetical protein